MYCVRTLLRCRAVIVLQQSAKALTSLNLALSRACEFAGLDELIRQPLMVSLSVIMREEFADSVSKGILAEEDHPIETLGS